MRGSKSRLIRSTAPPTSSGCSRRSKVGATSKSLDRHTAMDYAHVLKDLADVHFANARTIVLVQDNLNIHSKRHSAKPFLPPEPGAWLSASNGTTPQSTAVGSISRKPNSASWRPSASTAGSPTNKPSSKKSPLGSTTAMQTKQGQLALRNTQCSYQTQTPLPVNLNESSD